MNDRPSLIGEIRNARFLDIGSSKQMLAGTIYGHPKHADGTTFYSAPILDIEDDLVRTDEGWLRFSGSIH